MADIVNAWTPRSAWAGTLESIRNGLSGHAPLTIEPLDGIGLALISLPAAVEPALTRWLKERLSLTLPANGTVSRGPQHDLLWAGPGKFLLRSYRDFDPGLLRELAAIVPVTDQSDGRAVLRLSGERARDVLAKGVMVDLHPRVFGPGATMITPVAHIRVQIWRLDDRAGLPAFEILVPRSMTGSFGSWLEASAAEFGVRAITTGG